MQTLPPAKETLDEAIASGSTSGMPAQLEQLAEFLVGSAQGFRVPRGGPLVLGCPGRVVRTVCGGGAKHNFVVRGKGRVAAATNWRTPAPRANRSTP